MERELQENCKVMVNQLRRIFREVHECGTWCAALCPEADLIKVAANLIEELIGENIRLTNWKNDLLSGMYVNCIYCGHNYGLTEFTPEIMDEELARHVEHCERHPLHEAKETISNLEATIRNMFNYNTELAIRLNDLSKENTRLGERADNNQTCYASEMAEHERTKTRLRETEIKLQRVEKELQRIITDFSTTVEFWQNRIE